METVAELIKEGKVRYAGVCNYGLEDLEEAEKYIDLASDQVPYSMVNRDIEDEVIPWWEHAMPARRYRMPGP